MITVRPSRLLADKSRQVALLTVLLCTGCSQETQFGADHHRLLASLQTAISARRGDWLDATAKVISERHSAGQLDDQQSAVLEGIVAKARGGDWDGARDEIIRLQKGQRAGAGESRPTAAP